MTFNHYAKMKRILTAYDEWYIVRIDQPTTATNFKGEARQFDHYYRVVDATGRPIKFCKFQQLDRFARTMHLPLENLPLITEQTLARTGVLKLR